MGHPKDKSDEELLWESVRERDRGHAERDAYKLACEKAGVCMTCVIQPPETYGCSDCMNTGWQQGDPYERIKQLEAVVKRTLTWAEQRCPCKNEEPNPCPLCMADATKPKDICLSAENTIPRDLLQELRRVRA
jgi:hypothetical protein